MKLLIVTQAVDKDHPVVGFFHRWIEEFAKHCQQVIVICLQQGAYDLPDNVKVLSLGKEEGKNKLVYLYRFYKYIWQERKSYDSVFVHMNPEYVVLAGLLWKWWGKKVGLWYVHRSVTWKLRWAEKLVDIVFTASLKSFRLPSKKVKVIGHGIDIDIFKPGQEEKKETIILMVGRISPTKRQLEGIKIFDSILEHIPTAKLIIIGAPVLARDKRYYQQIKEYLEENNLDERVILTGPLANNQLPKYYQSASLLLNLSTTGSLDKDVLEAMACNLPVITTNESFSGILPSECLALSLVDVPDKVEYIINSEQEVDLRSVIIQNYSLKGLIDKIVRVLNN